jgi:uncharacterized protein (DUF1501 family)
MSRRRKAIEEKSRRDFLRAGCAALTTVSMVNTVWDLRMINAALASGTKRDFTDYRALVCIFLYGGNDAANTIIPTSAADYTKYSTARGLIAIPNYNPADPTNPANVIPINVANADGRTWGLHPACPGLQGLFNSGKLAVVTNVGPLVWPIPNVAAYNASPSMRPPQLFSHNDQQVEWMTSIPDQPAKTGWGGRCADMLMSAAYGANPGTTVSMNLTVGGTNTFEVGNSVNAYSVNSNGTVTTFGTGNGSSDLTNPNSRLSVMQQMFNDGVNHPNLFDREFARIGKRSQEAAAAVGGVFNNTLNPPLATNFLPANSSLANQLRTIARMIKAHSNGAWGTTGNPPQPVTYQRQIFFASVGGYDTHGDQLVAQQGLLATLSQGIASFNAAMIELGLEDKVTLFTASDFGRTFAFNGTGTDHAWGSHALIMGGAVDGGKFYGTMPDLALGNTAVDVGQGRWIPTTSVDQYSATLAKWFGGFTDGEIETIFPNISRFSPRYLDFMLPG